MGAGKGKNKRLKVSNTMSMLLDTMSDEELIKKKLLPELEVATWVYNSKLMEEWLNREQIPTNRKIVKHYTGEDLKVNKIQEKQSQILTSLVQDMLREGILTKGNKIKYWKDYEIKIVENWDYEIRLIHTPTAKILSASPVKTRMNSAAFLVNSKIYEKTSFYDKNSGVTAISLIDRLGKNIHLRREMGNREGYYFNENLKTSVNKTIAIPSNNYDKEDYNDTAQLDIFNDDDISLGEYYLGSQEDGNKYSDEEKIYILNEVMRDMIAKNQNPDFKTKFCFSSELNLNDFKIDGEIYKGIREQTFMNAYIFYQEKPLIRLEQHDDFNLSNFKPENNVYHYAEFNIINALDRVLDEASELHTSPF